MKRSIGSTALAVACVVTILLQPAPAAAQAGKPRFLIIQDTSGSMNWTGQRVHLFNFRNWYGSSVACTTHAQCISLLGTNAVECYGGYCWSTDGVATHGDGSREHPGCDVNGDGLTNDSKLYQAKAALWEIFAGYGEVEFALERYAAVQGGQACTSASQCPTLGGYQIFSCSGNKCRSCGTACYPETYTECNSSFTCGSSACVNENNDEYCTYRAVDQSCHGDTSQINGSVVSCPALAYDDPCVNSLGVLADSGGCLNGTGEVVTGFPSTSDNFNDLFKHINGDESDGYEFRSSGRTPIAGSLQAARTYLQGLTDSGIACRPYHVILITDGDETCGGDPVAAAAAMRLANGMSISGTATDVKTYVIGFSVCTPDNPNCTSRQTLNSIASSGGTTAAYSATNQVELLAALSDIIANSIPKEICNGLDDNCNNLVDESWPEKGAACAVGVGQCNKSGTWICKPAALDPTRTSTCCGTGDPDGAGTCLDAGTGGTAELCDGLDNDCDGQVDEGALWADKGQACSVGVGECTRYGVKICNPSNRAGATCCGDFFTGQCLTAGTGSAEVCNGKDDDCDGTADDPPLGDVGQACYTIAGNTGVGWCRAGVTACVGGALQCQNERGPAAEVCDAVDNNCNSQVDELWPEKGQPCSVGVGECRRSGTFICDPGDSTRTCCGSGGVCLTAGTPGTEVCNGKDDNCDGRVDEADPNGLGSQCYTLTGTPGNGPCKRGTLICQQDGGGGAALVCFGQVGPQPEVCDNADNDCNGTVDDNLTDVGDACNTIPGNHPGVGPCRAGTTACVAHALVCQNEVGPQPETCDGVDNNCDGRIDEDFPLKGTACDNGMVGVCWRGGHWACSADHTTVVCDAPVGPPDPPERCNGLDDDCNGLIDEADPALGTECLTLAGNTGAGQCRAGAWVCDPTAHALRCAGEVGPQPERCNGLDDNCDGTADEPWAAQLGQDCDNGGRGACLHAGHVVCKPDGSGVVCDAPPGVPQPEICNGLDDNCNDLIDDDVPGDDGQTPCSTAVGECLPGIKVCRNGHWECDGGTLPTPETCDGKDNNCNGEIDEHATVDEGGSCYEATDGTAYAGGCVASGGSWSCVGECRLGVGECQHPGGTATLVCVGAKGPGPELCNGKDDDCDGVPDNLATCPAEGEVCWNGQCVKPCKPDEFPCEAGLACFDLGPTPQVPCAQPGVDPTCFCVPSKCAGKQCAPGEHCDEASGACVNPCVPNPCQSWEVCQNGACYDCNTFGCPGGQKCVGNRCEDDPCLGVTCAAGEYCNSTGICQELCRESSCPHCYKCPADGTLTCVPDLCCEKGCAPGQYCAPDSGACVTDPCQVVSCPAGFVCEKVDGECVADPCRALSCGYCQLCQADVTVDPPLARCVEEPSDECKQAGVQYVTAQGGGCAAAGAAPGGGLVLILSLFGVCTGAARRRTRGGRR